MNFEATQDEVMRLLTQVFGATHLENKKENALRMLEEAIELAQASGLDKEYVEKICNQVYNKPIGNIRQEMAQVAIQLFRIAHCEDIWLEAALEEELMRIDNPAVMDKIREKHKTKVKVE